MFNKKKCEKCKWHGYLTNAVSKISGETRYRQLICDYAKYHDHTCLHAVGVEVEDRRGDDPNNCLLYVKGARPERNSKINITHSSISAEYYHYN